MEKVIKNKLDHLYEMLNKYNKLVDETGSYNWRVQALNAQIEALEDILYNRSDDWEIAYKEDVKESKRRA